MAGEMQMMISLYNVLMYLQIQLDILAKTHPLLQHWRRALCLMFLSDGEKPERRQFKPYLERRFWTIGSKMINQLINCKYQLIVRL
jgi:hypothetical protein